MIEQVPLEPVTRRTYRLAQTGDSNEAILTGMDIRDPAIMLAFLRALRPPDDPGELLRRPFAAKPHYAVRRSRFSDGTLPVYYSALEKETTRAELRHHNRLRFLGVTSILGMAVFMREVECTFQGQVKDLRPELGRIPHLVAEEADGGYETCNQIAAEARGQGLHGLLTPSARLNGGCCLPVFSQAALSEPVLGNYVTFTHDAANDAVVSAEVP